MANISPLPYRIEIKAVISAEGALYLTVGNSNNDSNIYWDSASDSDYQKWIFTEINF